MDEQLPSSESELMGGWLIKKRRISKKKNNDDKAGHTQAPKKNRIEFPAVMDDKISDEQDTYPRDTGQDPSLWRVSLT
ncbi:MAG: hypothetical protein OEW69_11685, partial [Nitrospirota bacterium]|nr:hypothetical protein [Nitrospirota bacterium]